MSRVFWDTNIFVYFLEASEKQGLAVRSLRERMLKRGDQLINSTMTLGEILVKPLQEGETGMATRYEAALKAAASILPFDAESARNYAQLRLNRTLKSPDVIQLACAAAAKVDLFITNDHRLHDLHVPGIQFIVPIDRVPI